MLIYSWYWKSIIKFKTSIKIDIKKCLFIIVYRIVYYEYYENYE